MPIAVACPVGMSRGEKALRHFIPWSDRRRDLAHPIEELVIGTGERQKPRVPVIHSQRRSGERNAGVRILVPAGEYVFRDFLAQISGHSNAMSGVTERVVHAI